MELEIGKYYKFNRYPYSDRPVNRVGLYIGLSDQGAFEFFFSEPIFVPDDDINNVHRCVIWDYNLEADPDMIEPVPETEFQKQVTENYNV